MTVIHSLSATTTDVEKQRASNRRSYYKHLEKRQAYYRELTRKRNAANPEGMRAYRREWDKQDRSKRGVPERVRRTPTEKKVLAALQYSRWSRANPHMTAALAAKRRARKKLATPMWANTSAIRELYKLAATLTADTGTPHEVDHVIPLANDGVCGLHWEGNLQVLTRAENIRKWNRYDFNS